MYRFNIGNLSRNLELVNLSKGIKGYYFYLPGDVKLAEKCAEFLKLLLSKVEFDIIVTIESGGIPLAHELSKLFSTEFVVIRKSVKPYMNDPIIQKVKSITSNKYQTLVLERKNADVLEKKKVLVVDDIISSGNTIKQTIKILDKLSLQIVSIATIFLEGDSQNSTHIDGYPILHIDKLPIYID